MYPNKAPPSAAPTIIPGEEPTKNKKHSGLTIFCLFQIKMIKVK